MKKNIKIFLTVLIAITLIVVCVLGLSACFLRPGPDGGDDNNNNNNSNNNNNNNNNNDNNNADKIVVLNEFVFQKRTDNGETFYELYRIDSSNRASSITVPSTVNDKPVRRIGQCVFENNTRLTDITLPDSITDIGFAAFRNCTSLVNVTIPNSVQCIEGSAFVNCTALESVQLPDKLECIDYYLFNGCSSLKSIVIPASVSTINDGAFTGCTSLSAITVDAKNANFCSEGGMLFDKDKTEIVFAVKSITSLDIPGSVTRINDNAFSGCDKITELKLPSSVKSVGSRAFENCSALNSIYMYDKLSSYGIDIFSGCDNITQAVLPADLLSSVTKDKLRTVEIISGSSISERAFMDCVALESVTLTTTWSIGSSAFSGCANLSSITLPSNLSIIGYNAFINCNNLTKLNYTGDISKWCQIRFSDEFANPITYTHSLYLSDELVTELVIPSVYEINSYAFSGCNSVTSIELSSGVKVIGEDAFLNCDNLTKVNYSGSMADWCGISFANEAANPTSYAHNLYFNDELVTEIIIPDTVREIKSHAFNGCVNVTKIELPNTVTSINLRPFANCDNIVEAVLPADLINSIPNKQLQKVTVTGGKIDYGAFSGCQTLTSATLLSGVTEIRIGAFRNCIALTSISIPDTLEKVERDVFYGCNNITEAVLPAAYLSIIPKTKLQNVQITGGELGANAFEGCAMLQNVTLSNDVTEIGSEAFKGCVALISINIPDTIETIKSNMFSGCAALEEISIPTSVTKIESGAFSGCASLTEFEISSSITEIGQGAFAGCEKLSSVTVDEDNLNYSSKDGILYDKDITVILFVPTGLSGAVTIPDTINTIGEYAFSGCDKLTGITVPDSVTEIGQNAFSGCSGLKNLNIASSVVTVGDDAFSGCDNITNAVLPTAALNKISKYKLQTVEVNGGTVIAANTFRNCANLTSAILSNELSSIESGAFKNCIKLAKIEIAAAIWNVADDAFSGCNSITEAKMSASFISKINRTNLKTVVLIGGFIPSQAFKGCARLTSVTLMEDVYSIGSEAFRNCVGITSLHIPRTASVGEGAFAGCTKLTDLTVEQYNNDCHIRDNILYNRNERTVLYAPVSITGKVVLPSSVERIGLGAFYGCSKITGIEIPATVTIVGDDAFYGCSNITEAKLPALAISKINASKLQKVEINAGVIAENAFSGCQSLADITITDGVTGIGRNAFSDTAYYADQTKWTNDALYIDNCLIIVSSSISGEFAIKQGTSLIADGAFNGCENMTAIDIPSSIAYIGSDVFSGCSSIVGAKLPLIATSKLPKDSLQSVEIFGVGAIADDEFNGCTTLNSVTISNGVTAIGSGAFSGCTQLSTVTIADSVVHIGDGAFSGTAYLSNDGNYEDGALYIGKILVAVKSTLVGEYSVKAETVQITNGAFSGCANLTSVIIPDSVTSIGAQAFHNCASLSSVTVAQGNGIFSSLGGILYNKNQTEIVYVPLAISGVITLPRSITSIGENSFYGRTDFTGIEIPDTVTGIGSNAFNGCSSLSSISIPASVVSIGNSAFENCASLNTVIILNPVETFGSDVFAGSGVVNATVHAANTSVLPKDSLQTVVITEGEIADEAFADCTTLTSVTISSGVTSIGVSAFNGTGITEIEIPDTVTSIGFAAFKNCKIAKATLSAAFIDRIPTNSSLQNITITNGEIKPYAFEDYFGLKSVTICEGVTAIGIGAFRGRSSLTSMHIPSTVTSIGENAFYNCSGMESITVAANNTNFCCVDGILYDKSVTTLIYAPAKLSGDIELPDTVNTISENAFYGCNAISSVVMPASVSRIFANAFHWCTAMKTLVIHSQIVSIGDKAFDGCRIENVTAPGPALYYIFYNAPKNLLKTATITYGLIGSTFSDFSALTTVTLENGVTAIGNYAFNGCSALTGIDIPGTVKSIGNYAFNNCSSITGITIESGLTSIGDNAFSGCIGITSINIPSTVTSIGSYAFSGCSLTSIEIPGVLTDLGNNAFNNCAAISSVSIPNPVETVGSNVFAGCDNIVTATFPAACVVGLNKTKLKTVVLTCGEICDEAFKDCTGITSITMLSGVTKIGTSAFSGCTNITALAIPDTVKSLGYYAFYHCTKLATLTVHEDNEYFVMRDDILYSKSNHTLYYALSSVSGEISINSLVIAPSAFEGNTKITKVTLFTTVTTIGECAFYNCSNLSYIEYLETDIRWDRVSRSENWVAGTKVKYVRCILSGAGSIDANA